MGSMLKMRQEVKSARSAMSAGDTLHGVLGKQAYTCMRGGQNVSRSIPAQGIKSAHTITETESSKPPANLHVKWCRGGLATLFAVSRGAVCVTSWLACVLLNRLYSSSCSTSLCQGQPEHAILHYVLSLRLSGGWFLIPVPTLHRLCVHCYNAF